MSYKFAKFVETFTKRLASKFFKGVFYISPNGYFIYLQLDIVPAYGHARVDAKLWATLALGNVEPRGGVRI